ncbi:hypothetical protein HMPREF1544_07450 [Mucor circinelloides 1006PhL]|uniref:CBM21 domain-containing protein n=1 Tax=Mucor circinelloides f. circinelloides (strain 1006PhL) TaxID=1220926 RepID=S2J6K3_MUCC1|nr:hypothetical protein HMPREF1544_07450 [Mucor circinelloides 1006PhL]KAG1113730.1 hypothetical protein G6F42_014382 [Rhizopus arrhizus]
MTNNRKRVSLNRRSSSLLLDYNAMLTQDSQGQEQLQEPSDYTRQLVASALSLPSSVRIETKVSTELPPSPPSSISALQQKHGADKIDLPQFRLKSSLKNPRSASAPCSPTIGLKSVRFHKTNLEDICLFRKAQTPLAISQKNIFWADSQDDEDDDDSDSTSSSSSDEEEQPIKKSIKCSNWPTRLSDIIDRKNKIIRVDKNTIRLQDDDFIVGKITVRNLNYHKTVTIRYTFDYWETVDNIQATYQESTQKNDLFAFKIHVPANAATLYFAINYKVGSEDYWDNNDGRNYQVDISLSKPNSTKKSSRSLVKSTSDLPQTTSLSASQDTLKSRYDFSQAKNIIPQTTSATQTQTQAQAQTQTSSSSSSQPISTIKQTFAMPIPIRRTVSSSPTGLSCHSPLASSPSFMDLNSQSYMELVNKYCFYSTSPSRSPMSING